MKRNVGLVEIPGEADAIGSPTDASRMAARRLGGYSLLEWLVRRISECESLDHIVVLASSAEDEAELLRLTPANVPVVSAVGADPLARCCHLAEQFEADSIVRIRLDQPLTDPSLIDQLSAAASRTGSVDFVGYSSRAGLGGSELRCVGLFAEWCRTDALERADRLARLPADRQQITRYLVTHPTQFRLAWLSPPAALDREDLRLVLHRADDWDHVHEIIEALGHDSLDWQTLVELLESQAEMRGRMARLNSVRPDQRGLATAAAD